MHYIVGMKTGGRICCLKISSAMGDIFDSEDLPNYVPARGRVSLIYAHAVPSAKA